MPLPTKVERLAPAKVNLALHVTGKRADGYHLLDSLVAFADFGDRLSIEIRPDTALTVTGPLADRVPEDRRNLCWQAAEFFGETAAITLEKHLPMEAGIGGGSSDAAAVLLGLSELTGKPVPHGAELLGADVPVCLAGQAARMQGVGEDVTPTAIPALPALLVNPRVSVETPRIFKGLEKRDNPGLPMIPLGATRREFCAWLREQRNDLTETAVSLCSEIGVVLKALSELPGQLGYAMSGSGATCFALFDTVGEAELAAMDIERAHPEWWVRDCVLS